MADPITFLELHPADKNPKTCIQEECNATKVFLVRVSNVEISLEIMPTTLSCSNYLPRTTSSWPKSWDLHPRGLQLKSYSYKCSIQAFLPTCGEPWISSTGGTDSLAVIARRLPARGVKEDLLIIGRWVLSIRTSNASLRRLHVVAVDDDGR